MLLSVRGGGANLWLVGITDFGSPDLWVVGVGINCRDKWLSLAIPEVSRVFPVWG